MRMKFKGSFLYFRPTWILEDDKIIVRKKVYYISKMKNLEIYIPPNSRFSPYISFVYDNDSKMTVIFFSRKAPDFSRVQEAFKYIESNTKEGIQNRGKEEKLKIEREQEIKKQTGERKRKEQEEIKLKEKMKYFKKRILNNPFVFYMYTGGEEFTFDYEVIIDIFKKIPNNYKFKDLEKIIKIKNRDNSNGILIKFEDCSKQIMFKKTEFERKLDEEISKKSLKSHSLYEESKIAMKKMMKESAAYSKAEREYKYKKDYIKKLCDEIENDINLRIYFKQISLLYLFILEEYSEIFKKNEELYLIYENLYKSEVSREYISEKIYDIYSEFYKEIFDKQLSKDDMECIIYIIEQKQKYDISGQVAEESYKTINELLSRTKKIENKIDIIKEFLISKYSNIEDEKLGLQIQKSILNDIIYIINEPTNNIDLAETFVIIEKYDSILLDIKNQIKNRIKSKKVAEERDRLLNGDVSQEIEFRKLELDFNNVKDGFEFEDYVAKLYSKLGYTIEQVTKKSGDQGADVVAIKNDTKYVIQAKFYNTPVGNKAVQEVVASLAMYKADKGIVVTNNTFTQSAKELANANNIELVDGKTIEEYKKQILAKI